MKNYFQEAARFRPEPGDVVAVAPNRAGILTTRVPERYLFTNYAYVCSGLALLSEDNSFALLSHIYSDVEYYAVGQKAVEAHSRNVWQRIEKKLPHDKTYKAVFFGGQNKQAGATVSDRMALRVSNWIGDSFYAAAIASGLIVEHDDLRYRDSPHDALIDRKNGEIYIGREQERLMWRIGPGRNIREARGCLPVLDVRGCA